jgi:hypothetical protein
MTTLIEGKHMQNTDQKIFKHQDGGFYRYLDLAQHADDKSVHVRYEHLWPFETGLPWLRRLDEWESRFKPVTEAELQEAMKQDRTAAQEAVTRAKAERRAKRDAAPQSTSV